MVAVAGFEAQGAVSRMGACGMAVALLAFCIDADAAGSPSPAQAPADAVLVAAADFPAPALEVNTTSVPRFDVVPGGASASRLDITLLPQRRSAVGLSLGMSNSRPYAPGAFAVTPGSSALDLGLRWRYTVDNSVRFDVTAYRRMPSTDAISLIESREPSYGARVEMGLGSIAGVRKGFVADHGFVGLQLESGARVTVRRSHGVPMLYYRNTF